MNKTMNSKHSITTGIDHPVKRSWHIQNKEVKQKRLFFNQLIILRQLSPKKPSIPELLSPASAGEYPAEKPLRGRSGFPKFDRFG
jgi:hypothetical protein